MRAGADEVIGVSRFSNPLDRDDLEARGIATIKCDLLDDEGLAQLPRVPYLYLMAGHKFGATGNEPLTLGDECGIARKSHAAVSRFAHCLCVFWQCL